MDASIHVVHFRAKCYKIIPVFGSIDRKPTSKVTGAQIKGGYILCFKQSIHADQVGRSRSKNGDLVHQTETVARKEDTVSKKERHVKEARAS